LGTPVLSFRSRSEEEGKVKDSKERSNGFGRQLFVTVTGEKDFCMRSINITGGGPLPPSCFLSL